MRTGPSRLTSTALSSGESKLTVAAEWMKMSQLATARRPSSSRPRPSIETSPEIATTRRAVISSKALGPAQLAAQSIERVVAEDLAGDAVAGAASSGAHDEHQLAVGHGAQESLDERGAEEAGRARDRDAFAG